MEMIYEGWELESLGDNEYVFNSGFSCRTAARYDDIEDVVSLHSSGVSLDSKDSDGRTGASSGIGSETARVLALRGVHLVMAVRNLSAGANVRETIVKEIPTAKVDVMELDLTSMASVRKFASEFNSLNLPLNILINNAGIMATPFLLSQDGIEMQFATNHVGHFLLTHLLLDNMKNASRETKIEGRIVIVSSEGHQLAYHEGIRFDKLNDQPGYSPSSAYRQSKLANILHANELSRRFKEEDVEITANSLHHGIVITNLLGHHSFLDAISRYLGKLVMKNVQQGFIYMSPHLCSVW